MTETTPTPRTTKESRPGRVKRYFDGIAYLLRRSETRFILLLMILLFGSMLGYYGALVILTSVSGQSNFLIRASLYGDPFFMALFVFILIELIRLSRMGMRPILSKIEKEPGSPEATPSDSSSKVGGRRIRLWVFLILVAIVVPCYVILLLYEIFFYGFVWAYVALAMFHYWFGVGYMFFLFGLLVIIGFLAARGSIISFEDRFLDTFHRRPNYFFFFLPIPWILLIVLLSSASILNLFYGILGDVTLLLVYLWAVFVYAFLCVASLIAVFKRQWRAGFTVSQISASLTLLWVILIPFFIDMGFSLVSPLETAAISLGPIVSLLALIFLYLQGTLDEYGDDLREFHTSWETILDKMKSIALSEGPDHIRERAIDPTLVLKGGSEAYRKVALGLMLFLLTIFGIISVIGPIFPLLGFEEGLAQVDALLLLDSYFEMLGIGIGVIVALIMTGFLKGREVTS